MEGDDGRDWVPERPRHDVVWADDASGPVLVRPFAEERPRQNRRRRIPPGPRILGSYLALVVAVVLVVVVGAGLQPSYGSSAPMGGVVFPDFRTAPDSDGWSVDLATFFEPDAPGSCVSLAPGAVDSRHELVTASLPSSRKGDGRRSCSGGGRRAPGRVAMIDPATGRTEWTRDLGADLHQTIASLVWHASVPAGVVVVGVDGSRGPRMVSLDIDTGAVLSSATLQNSDEVINFAVTSQLVLTASPHAGAAVTTYTLRRADRLDRPLWDAPLSASTFPELLPDRLLVPNPGGTVSIDGSTGAETRWPTNLRGMTGVRTAGDTVLAITAPEGVGLRTSLISLDRYGHRQWKVDGADIVTVDVSRDCVVTESSGGTMTCLEPSTGRVRWSTDLAGLPSGTAAGARTDDVQSIGIVRSGDSALRVTDLDGRTGRIRFVTTIPRGSRIAGVSRTTGYAVDDPAEDGRGRVTAFDLDSGRTLWSLEAASVQSWSGTLVTVSSGAVVRQLVNAPTNRHHGMLSG